MKYITFTVPCYNSAAYMERCVDSLLIGGEDVEILLIDDGSTDRTGRSRTNMSETIRESCVRYTSRTADTAPASTRDCTLRRAVILKWWIRMTGFPEDAYRRLLCAREGVLHGSGGRTYGSAGSDRVAIILTITWRRERRTRWRTGMYSRRKRPVPGMTSDISDRPSI